MAIRAAARLSSLAAMGWIRSSVARIGHALAVIDDDSDWRRVDVGLEARRKLRFEDTDSLEGFLEKTVREFPRHVIQLEVAGIMYPDVGVEGQLETTDLSAAHRVGVQRLSRGSSSEGSTLRVRAHTEDETQSWGLELLGVSVPRASRIVSGNLEVPWPGRWDILERVGDIVSEYTVGYGRSERRRDAPLVEAISRPTAVQNAVDRKVASDAARVGGWYGLAAGLLGGSVTVVIAWLIERAQG